MPIPEPISKKDREMTTLTPASRRLVDPIGSSEQRVELPLYGLLRSYEAADLEARLNRVPGVADVVVDPITDIVDVRYDSARTSVATVAGAIEQAGYRLR
jgi:copper chaperone CopZ